MDLLKEEMRRTIVTLRGRACLWKTRATVDRADSQNYAEGLSAYAFSQADLLNRLATKYEQAWTMAGGGIEDAESDRDLEEDLGNQLQEERVEEAEMGL